MDLKETYNLIAEDWHQDHGEEKVESEGLEVFASKLIKGDHVLDVGCGSGIKAKFLEKYGFKITGIDFSEKMVEIAKKEVPKGEFLLWDVSQLEELPGKYAGVFASDVLLHFPKNEVHFIMEQLKNKLRKNGYLFISVKEVRPGRPEEEVVEENDYGYSYERFFSYYTLPELRTFCLNLNLQIVYEHSESFGSGNSLTIIAKLS